MPPLLHYLLLLLLLLSSILLPGARGAASGRPEIYPHQEEITVGVGKPLNLTCRAAQPVAWCTHYNFTDEKNYEEVYEDWHDKPYTSILTIDAVNISHVGYFSCVFNTSENKEKNLNCDVKDPSVTSLYLYVKDPDHLLSTQKHMVLQVAVGEPIVLPCKPNFPGVKMTLFKNYFEYVRFK